MAQLALIAVAAVACCAWLFGTSISLRAGAAGWIGIGLLAAFVAWTGVTIAYSVAPDRSWIELNRALAYLLMLLCAMGVGSSIPDAPRRLASAYGFSPSSWRCTRSGASCSRGSASTA